MGEYKRSFSDDITSDGIKIPSIKDWIIWSLLMIIPLVNIVLIFVWAFDKDPANKVRSNYFKASLLLFAIVFVFSILVSFLILGTSSLLAN